MRSVIQLPSANVLGEPALGKTDTLATVDLLRYDS